MFLLQLSSRIKRLTIVKEIIIIIINYYSCNFIVKSSSHSRVIFFIFTFVKRLIRLTNVKRDSLFGLTKTFRAVFHYH